MLDFLVASCGLWHWSMLGALGLGIIFHTTFYGLAFYLVAMSSRIPVFLDVYCVFLYLSRCQSSLSSVTCAHTTVGLPCTALLPLAGGGHRHHCTGMALCGPVLRLEEMEGSFGSGRGWVIVTLRGRLGPEPSLEFIEFMRV